jgi:dienelactone hydrolase
MLAMRLGVLLVAILLGVPALAQTDPWVGVERRPGKVASIAAKLNEEAWFVPGGPGADGRPALLKARVHRPSGNGPFMAAIINHGSPTSADGRPGMRVPAYRAAAEWFVARGYMVVMPLRRGYGESGAWPETYGPCRNPDFVAAGNASADDIEAVTRYLRTLPMVRKDRVLLVGQSAGGFGVIATARRNPDGVFAAINVAGGRGGHQGELAGENCAPDRLVQAAAALGRGARVPMLWLYTQNDTFFAPALSRRMHEAYRAAGGTADYVLLPSFRKEGHEMFGQADGLPLWTQPAAAFLARLE